MDIEENYMYFLISEKLCGDLFEFKRWLFLEFDVMDCIVL